MVPFYAASGAFEPLVAGPRIDLDVNAAQTLVLCGFELVFEFHLIGARVSRWCLFPSLLAFGPPVAGPRIDLDVKAAQTLGPCGFELGFDFYLLGAHVSGWCLFIPCPALGSLVAGP